ncbi:TcfC E-set like domain-containing protein [Vibrio sp. 1CM2L]|uniref:TcfC E-set like domain-containing protein n=1 Tax=Vibrio sp. 1CM2L TaxID=2929166 RepID=UPI0020BFAB8C|nr:TcfC E-set like domain-containing protein [Vibrio sp. 1CM2L]MCK8075884.1 TcfC E-set like domain-containing protein [Vibrio sp. 1CM2L]
MMLNKTNCAALGLIFYSTTLLADALYPEGFSDFFIETEKKIGISIAGEKSIEEISAIVNYEEFRVEKYSDDYDVIQSYLTKLGIRSEIIKQILGDLTRGVVTDKDCEGRLEQCVLTSQEATRYVFDFDSATLKLFLPINSLRTDLGVVEYESPINKENALINWMNVYGFTDFDNNDYANVSNQSILGLPVGHVHLDTQFSTKNSEFEVYKAMYDADFNGHRLQVGVNQHNLSFNTTDFLNNNARLGGESIFFGSSRNLLKNATSNQQKIYFYVPQSAQLEVYREKQLLLNRPVTEGRKAISYSELPGGAYEITVVLKVGGEIILSEQRQVVNNDRFSLEEGSVDYVIGMGQLDDHYSLEDEIDKQDKYYGRALVGYRYNDYLIANLGFSSNANEQYYQAGGSFFYGDTLSLDLMLGLFSKQSEMYSARLSLAPFYIDYRVFDNEKTSTSTSFSNLLYGEDSYKEYGVGWSGDFLQGSIYVRYDYFSSEDSIPNNDFTTGSSSERSSISSGWSRSLPFGDISLNFNYDQYRNDNDDYHFGITWSKDLGTSGIVAQSSIYTGKNGFDRNITALRAERTYDNAHVTGSAGTIINNDNQIVGELSGTLNSSNDVGNFNSYAYVNDDGRKTVSGNFTGSQIFGRQGFDVTNKRSSAFVKVNKTEQRVHEDPFRELKVVINQDDSYRHRVELKSDASIVDVREFQSLDVKIDEGSENVDVEGRRLQAFVHPGSLYQLDTNIVELLSRIVVLDDLHNNPIEHLQCVGQGCVSVEPLSEDGVYRINFRQSKPYRLISKQGLCVLDESLTDEYVTGYCLPGLSEENKGLSISELNENLLSKNNTGELMIYLGMFNRELSEVSVIKSNLERVNINYREVVVGRDVHIYAVNNESFNSAQKYYLEELDSYIMIQSSDSESYTLN